MTRGSPWNRDGAKFKAGSPLTSFLTSASNTDRFTTPKTPMRHTVGGSSSGEYLFRSPLITYIIVISARPGGPESRDRALEYESSYPLVLLGADAGLCRYVSTTIGSPAILGVLVRPETEDGVEATRLWDGVEEATRLWDGVEETTRLSEMDDAVEEMTRLSDGVKEEAETVTVVGATCLVGQSGIKDEGVNWGATNGRFREEERHSSSLSERLRDGPEPFASLSSSPLITARSELAGFSLVLGGRGGVVDSSMAFERASH